MTRQEKFINLLKSHGYKSLSSFCNDHGLQQSNFNKRLKYEGLSVDVKTMFQLANALKEPIEVMIEIFYPDEFQENRNLIEK